MRIMLAVLCLKPDRHLGYIRCHRRPAPERRAPIACSIPDAASVTEGCRAFVPDPLPQLDAAGQVSVGQQAAVVQLLGVEANRADHEPATGFVIPGQQVVQRRAAIACHACRHAIQREPDGFLGLEQSGLAALIRRRHRHEERHGISPVGGPPSGRAGSSGRLESVEMLIARNPDPESRLPYLLLLPLAGGMVFRTSGTWPRTNALYCYPVSEDEWPEAPDIVERAGLRSCSAGRRDRPRLGQRAGESIPDRLHHGPWPRRRLLAVPAHPQAGSPKRVHPQGPGRRDR